MTVVTKWWLVVIGVAVLVASSVLITFLTYDRVVYQAVPSPSGERVAVLHDLGEGGPLPYGQQLVIHRPWVPMKNVFGAAIFRGYCGGVLRWRSDSELELDCNHYENVEIKRDLYDGIRIVYR